MGLGFEFLRGSKGPDVNVALGMQLKSNDFVLKIVPEIVMTTGSKWDASVMGGFWYGATAELEAHFGNFWLEPSLKIVKYQDRNLGDPEKQTTYSEEDSLRVALGLAYQPVSGLYASAKQKMWALGKSNLTSPGLNLDMASDVIWVSELTVGWSWDRKRLSGRVITVSGVNNDEQHAFRARGAFEDHLLSKQRAEVEMQWLF
ncbi:MAG: hypothetical protein ABIR96_05840 [Bdellovibrionota bacterium]